LSLLFKTAYYLFLYHNFILFPGDKKITFFCMFIFTPTSLLGPNKSFCMLYVFTSTSAHNLYIYYHHQELHLT